MTKTNSKSTLDHLNYLTTVNSEESMRFVDHHNKKADNHLKSDPRYQESYSEILNILSAKDKLPQFFHLNESIYNFWQDETHEKGILRSTSIYSFNVGQPNWKNLIDMDLLSKNEEKNLVYKGIQCFEPQAELCLVSISDGGKDSNQLREFNLILGEFVKKGFNLPESKSHAAWVNKDILLVGDGSATARLSKSGYPLDVKILNRGQNLSESQTIFKAKEDSVSVYVYAQVANQRQVILITDQVSFFEAEYYMFNNLKDIIKINLPKTANIEAIFKEQIVFSIRENYKEFKAGSVLSIPLEEASYPSPKISVVYSPSEVSYFQRLQASKNYLYVELLKDVRTEILSMDFVEKKWSNKDLKIPNLDGNEVIRSLNGNSDHVYFINSDFLSPSSIYYLNEKLPHDAKKVLSSPHRFNTENLIVRQVKVKSKDGTTVPYFLIHKKDLKYDSTHPTLLYGYGGFEISLTPSYLATVGKAWLEKGGVYVLANIRGGGEYGPNWHRSALRENRHKAYEDFYAIAEDLINQKITSPEKLGIKGGSNGGLLTAVAFTQRPDLFKAVISEVPLANMLEYHRWLAGASWVEEYGDPEDAKMKDYLLSYSPLHNLKKEIRYPEVFFLTSTKDDRVHPAHARQMVARLTELGHPVLYNENKEGGHGRATNNNDMADFLALEFTYLYQKLMGSIKSE